MTTDPAHIDAVAQQVASPAGETAWDRARDASTRLLDSTDPDVHAAMLDALTRHGVLTARWGAMTEHGVVEGAERLTRPYRRLVTPWEVTP